MQPRQWLAPLATLPSRYLFLFILSEILMYILWVKRKKLLSLGNQEPVVDPDAWPAPFFPGAMPEVKRPSLYDVVVGTDMAQVGRYYTHVEVPVNCTALFYVTDPRFQADWYRHVMAPALALYETFVEFDPMVWTDPYVRTVIDWHIVPQGNVTCCPSAPNSPLHKVISAAALRHKRVLVYGSVHPALEARVLALGARTVDSVLPIPYSRQPHSRLRLLSGESWRREFLDGAGWRPYDAAVVGPRLSRAGLGTERPGLYPNGDVVDLAKVWCMTKLHGSMVMQLPRARGGSARWPSLTANWEQLDQVNLRPPLLAPLSRLAVKQFVKWVGRKLLHAWPLVPIHSVDLHASLSGSPTPRLPGERLTGKSSPCQTNFVRRMEIRRYRTMWDKFLSEVVVLSQPRHWMSSGTRWPHGSTLGLDLGPSGSLGSTRPTPGLDGGFHGLGGPLVSLGTLRDR